MTWQLFRAVSRPREHLRFAGASAALAALAACAATACAAPRTSTPVAARTSPPAIGATDASATEDEAPPGVSPFDALTARGPADAPLMREAMRVDDALARPTEIRADRDVCLRAVFAAARPVRVGFTDEAGVARGESTTASSGTAPPRGPVCAKKGEVLHLVIESPSGATVVDGGTVTDSGAPGAGRRTRARAVIFAAP